MHNAAIYVLFLLLGSLEMAYMPNHARDITEYIHTLRIANLLLLTVLKYHTAKNEQCEI